MKRIALGIILALMAASASAYTFWSNGVLMGTVCRYGGYWTSYPSYMAQPVGTSCPIRDTYGNVIGTGVVTTE